MSFENATVYDLLRELRSRDCAVVCFVPDELLGADPERVEDRLIELGWDVIDSLRTEEDEDIEDEG